MAELYLLAFALLRELCKCMDFAKECEEVLSAGKDQKGLLRGRVVGQPTERNLRAEGDCEGSLHLFL